MRTVLILIMAALVGSCSVFVKEPAETAYVIVDRSTSKALSAYYVDDTDRVVRTETYGDDAKVSRLRSYEYDDGGNVRAMIQTEPGLAPRTITFSTEVVQDAQGRVERIVQRSDSGASYESIFAYDEAGVLRGTVVRGGNDSVVMQDYQDE